MSMHGKGKLGYFTVSTKPPKQEDEMASQTWEAENSMVMCVNDSAWYNKMLEKEGSLSSCRP
ncbi:hypothetical protein CK203_023558 [Vitis vinifera]|uniref:Uncharacterized protein n=1 Tax=Vitis vinifera TaxID=29760 RepID=A0A438JC02_VITVI|nr:hypothetical protein CK203_023558 [Vitis vinifera]